MPEQDQQLAQEVRAALDSRLPDPGFDLQDLVDGGRRRRRRRGVAVAAGGCAAVLVGAMAVASLPGIGDGTAGDVAPASNQMLADWRTATQDPDERVVVMGRVIGAGGADPTVCLGEKEGITTGDCGGEELSIAGWAPPAPTSDDTWPGGDFFRMEGTVEDGVLTSTGGERVEEPWPEWEEFPSYEILCDAPPGGWTYSDDITALDDVEEISHYWGIRPSRNQSAGPAPDLMDGIEVPAVAVDEGDDLAAAQQAAEEAAGGPVCAVETDRSMERAEEIADQLRGQGFGMVEAEVHPQRPQDARVVVPVRYDDGSLQETLDEDLGEGWVSVQPLIAPADEG